MHIAFQGLGLDYGRWQDLELEKGFLNAILPVDVDIPESSFLDLLVALSLLPLAIFTTMAVLGGGEQDPPKWLIGNEGDWVNLYPEEDEAVGLPAPGETTEGTGEDVHEIEESPEEEEEEDESFLFSDLAEELDALSDD